MFICYCRLTLDKQLNADINFYLNMKFPMVGVLNKSCLAWHFLTGVNR